MAEISKGMDERDVQLAWKRKIRFSVDPRWPLVSQRRFFPAGNRAKFWRVSPSRQRKTAAAKFPP